MSRIRLISTGGASAGAAVAGHLRDLQRDGPVLFVTADRSAASWAAEWVAAGVDPRNLVVIDAVSAMNATQPARGPANWTFLPSPAMLEMMAMRIGQLIQRHAPVRVVIDSLGALALHNGSEGVHEFAHYLGNRLRGTGVGADLVLHGGPGSAALREGVAPFVDEHVRLDDGWAASSLPLEPAP